MEQGLEQGVTTTVRSLRVQQVSQKAGVQVDLIAVAAQHCKQVEAGVAVMGCAQNGSRLEQITHREYFP
ncbi:hypothetical protein D3C79_1076500 [compost metagenome]